MQQIADGLSREPWDLTPELRDRKRSIREFKVDEFLDLQEGDGAQNWTIPGHAPPNPDSSTRRAGTVVQEALAAVGARTPLRVLVLEDHRYAGRVEPAWLVQALDAAFP